MFHTMTMLALLAALMGPQAAVQNSQPAADVVPDVVVTAEARADMARRFVNRVSAPARGRGLGRWRKVCPVVANLARTSGQAIADRIALNADALGVEVEGPGCEANIVVVFAPDARALTQTLVETQPAVFRGQGGGIDRGGAALRAFQQSDSPIRWWSLSVPIDSQSGTRAVRIPGDRSGLVVDAQTAAIVNCNPNDCAIGAAPLIRSTTSSRINSQIVDQLYKVIVIVDIDAVSGLNTTQLGDYLSMVSLSQVDPEGDTSGFDTVLNLFDDPVGVQGLTDWDRSYLEALYNSPSQRLSVGAQATAVAGIMAQDAPSDGPE